MVVCMGWAFDTVDSRMWAAVHLDTHRLHSADMVEQPAQLVTNKAVVKRWHSFVKHIDAETKQKNFIMSKLHAVLDRII